MDESDSEDESPQKARGGDDDLNKYPVDGLFISHAEKQEILSMREIEREQKIAERREEIERIRQNRMLRQLVVNQQDNKKRKAAAADLDDGQRKPSRVRTKTGETSSKMDALHRAREERNNRNQQREAENDRRSRRRSPSYGRRSASRDSSRSSEVSWAGGKSKRKSSTPEPKVSPEAELRDIERVRVGRSRFADVCFHPGLEEALTGCFVRVNIGPDGSKGNQQVYRMAVIKGTNWRISTVPHETAS
jgi:RNA polymerase-associated protein RTF1